MNDYIQSVQALLARDPAEVATWERGVFPALAGELANRLVLCGAGGLGRRTLAGLRRIGVEPIAFADNNPRLEGKLVEGVPVYSAAEAAARFGDNALFVVTVWGAHGRDRLADRLAQWRRLGCRRVASFHSLYWEHPGEFLPHYTCDLPHRVFAAAPAVLAAAALWSDELSRAEYIAQIRWRTELDFAGLPEPVAGAAYFPPDLVRLLPEERFLDCGAFNGDTLADFLRESGGEFSHYWALEPDPANFAALRERVAGLDAPTREKITALPLAADERAGRLRFSADATAGSARSDEGGIEVEGIALDERFADAAPTFVKMDIEGAELAALRGAEHLLRRCRPIVAVSAYHAQADLWEIPNLLGQMLENYQFHLRPHDREGWDLVCYAIPRERTLSTAISPTRMHDSPRP